MKTISFSYCKYKKTESHSISSETFPVVVCVVVAFELNFEFSFSVGFHFPFISFDFGIQTHVVGKVIYFFFGINKKGFNWNLRSLVKLIFVACALWKPCSLEPKKQIEYLIRFSYNIITDV